MRKASNPNAPGRKRRKRFRRRFKLENARGPWRGDRCCTFQKNRQPIPRKTRYPAWSRWPNAESIQPVTLAATERASQNLMKGRNDIVPVSYTHLRAHETPEHL